MMHGQQNIKIFITLGWLNFGENFEVYIGDGSMRILQHDVNNYVPTQHLLQDRKYPTEWLQNSNLSHRTEDVNCNAAKN